MESARDRYYGIHQSNTLTQMHTNTTCFSVFNFFSLILYSIFIFFLHTPSEFVFFFTSFFVQNISNRKISTQRTCISYLFIFFLLYTTQTSRLIFFGQKPSTMQQIVSNFREKNTSKQMGTLKNKICLVCSSFTTESNPYTSHFIPLLRNNQYTMCTYLFPLNFVHTHKNWFYSDQFTVWLLMEKYLYKISNWFEKSFYQKEQEKLLWKYKFFVVLITFFFSLSSLDPPMLFRRGTLYGHRTFYESTKFCVDVRSFVWMRTDTVNACVFVYLP